MSVSLPILEDACANLPYSKRAMFGGHGLFAPNGGMFAAVVDDDRIVFKLADDTARAELEALGGRPWTYADKMTMREWILAPDAFYDDQESMETWARRAHTLVPPRKAKPPKRAATEAPAKKVSTPKKSAKSAPPKKSSAKSAAPKKSSAKSAAAKKSLAKSAAPKKSKA
ncbi:TfoX/Sxy family protein [Myxococcota bacterium]|nr:TfoX/Sxy family protein [Myxococcota bacterium]